MNYQFQSDQGGHIFQPHFSRSIVRTLILINAGLFLIRYLMVGQFDMLSLGLSSNPKLWQPITYMFVHGDFFHIFMNMFVLWMFGTEMESIWGGKKFLQYYLMTGIGSGLVWLLFNYNNNYTILIGASGAIYGVLVAFTFMFPNSKLMLLFPPIPVKAKYLVPIIILGDVFFGFTSASIGPIAHFAHLGGAITGFLMMWYWKKNQFNNKRWN